MTDHYPLDQSGLLKDELHGRVATGVGVGTVILGTGHFPDLDDIDDGHVRFLMGRRGALRTKQNPEGVRNEPHCWDFPGGGVDFGERLEHAARREATEELSASPGSPIIIRSVQHMFHIEHFPPSLGERQHWISHTFAMTLDPSSPEPCVPAAERFKCSTLRYFTLRELLSFRSGLLTSSMQLNLRQFMNFNWQSLTDEMPELRGMIF